MEAIEFHKKKIQFAKDLDELVDDLAEAAEEKPAPGELQKLISEGEKKVLEYEYLLAEIRGGMRNELVSSYSTEVDEIRRFLSEFRKIPR